MKTSIRPVRIYLPPDEFGTVTVRTVGHRAYGSDGWKGPTRKHRAEARKDARLRRLEAS